MDLNDSDRALLRGCPFTVTVGGKVSNAALAKLSRVKRLYAAGFITGKVTQAAIGDPVIMEAFLSDAGLRALGRRF